MRRWPRRLAWTQTPPVQRKKDGWPGCEGRRAGEVSLMPRDARAKQNIQLCGDVNEGISLLEAAWLSLEPIPFVCECAEVGCAAPVYLTADEFRDLRSRPGHYVTIPGHVRAVGERVVVSTRRYWVVTEVEAGARSTPP